MKLHLGLEWRSFHILNSEDIDDVISHFYTVVCVKCSCLYNKKKITWQLEDTFV